MFDQVLFPVDGSRETNHALPLVSDIAQRYHSNVLLLSVLDPAQLNETEVDKARATIQSLLHQSEVALQKMGVLALKTEYREGKIPFVICDVADELGMDLIVMGCRGLIGEEQESHSVSNRVINLAPCPVLVVP